MNLKQALEELGFETIVDDGSTDWQVDILIDELSEEELKQEVYSDGEKIREIKEDGYQGEVLYEIDGLMDRCEAEAEFEDWLNQGEPVIILSISYEISEILKSVDPKRYQSEFEAFLDREEIKILERY